MPLTSPPAVPQRGDRSTFSDRVDAFLRWIANTNIPELNSYQANLNSIAIGGAYTITFLGAPIGSIGSSAGGKFALGGINGSEATATSLYVDVTSSSGVAVANALDSITSSSSSVKAAVRIVKQADPNQFLTFNITGVSVFTYYRIYSVQCIANGPNPSPFGDNDLALFNFTRTGDSGATGPAGNSVTPILWIRDEKASGTGGGNPVTGTNTRVLNTVLRNTMTGASLSSNRFILPAGTFRFWGSASGQGMGAHQASIYNVTLGNTMVNGTTECTNTGVTTRSLFIGDVTLSSSQTFELRHWSQSSSGSWGTAAGTGLFNECYSELIFAKVA